MRSGGGSRVEYYKFWTLVLFFFVFVIKTVAVDQDELDGL